MLKNILELIAEHTGLNPNVPDQRALMIKNVNISAERLNRSTDLENVLVEEDFNFAVDSQIVAFPPRVAKIRKMRYITSRLPITVGDQRVRFHTSGDTESWMLRHTFLRESPLMQDLQDECKLIFEIPAPETYPITYTAIGGNSDANHVVETVVLPTGSTRIETLNVFSGVKRLFKANPLRYDTTLLDIHGNILSVIPNNFKEVKCQHMRILDRPMAEVGQSDSTGIEVLYKQAYAHMSDDYDSFICGDIYDEAIVWEYIKAFGPQDIKAEAVAFQAKCLMDIGRDADKGKDKRFDAAENPYYKIQAGIKQGAYRNRRRYF